MINISYDHDLNNVNIELFNRFGMDYPKERRFRCVCCKDPICLNTKFDGNILKAHDWMQED